ncbi:MAG: hypothetical protein IPN76_32660 [Saprospiraceae bacterium]|nr:hypothetical protein [Saprospiraceae bacterium]
MSNEDKNTSDLKRLLQEKLANSEAAGDGWNVPSGKVWSGLSEELVANQQVLKRDQEGDMAMGGYWFISSGIDCEGMHSLPGSRQAGRGDDENSTRLRGETKQAE